MTQTEKNKHKFNDSYRTGTELLHRGKAEKALPFLEEAHSLDQKHVDASLNLGGAYILTKRFEEAISILEPLSQKAPENMMVWINLGAAYLGNPLLANDEQQRRAISAFERALTINPAAPHAAYNLGLIYRDRGDLEEAISWFREALKANPNDDHARRLQAQLLETSQDNGSQ